MAEEKLYYHSYRVKMRSRRVGGDNTNSELAHVFDEKYDGFSDKCY